MRSFFIRNPGGSMYMPTKIMGKSKSIDLARITTNSTSFYEALAPLTRPHAHRAADIARLATGKFHSFPLLSEYLTNFAHIPIFQIKCGRAEIRILEKR